MAEAGESEPLVLVAHSGAGPLLPAIRSVLSRPVAAYVFVDAGWPSDGKSRFDLFENRQAVEQFQQGAVNGCLPVWSNVDLREVIPDNNIRERFASELKPTPLAVYTEPLPVFAGWPDAPVAYLQFTEPYNPSATAARAAGWPMKRLDQATFTS